MKKPTKRKKIFANDMANKELITNIYKQLIQLNIKKQTKKTKQPDFKNLHQQIYKQ